MKRRLTTILPSFILLVPSSFGARSVLFIKANVGISSYTIHFPDAGLYIERYQDQYIYSFWLSADRYPELDCAEVNDSNKYFYDNVYTAVSDICRRFELPYDWLIAGVESVFQYSEDYRRMVTTAHNITAFSSRYIDEELGLFLKKEGYKVRRVEPIESDAFEIFEKTGACI